MPEIFEFIDYIKYLTVALGEAAKTQRGIKSRLSTAIQCHPAYLTRVLSGKADFSLEQAARVSEFFGHTAEETRYFLCLVEYGRAGTPKLREIFAQEIRDRQNTHLHKRKQGMSKESLPEAARAIYYSSWQYAAVLTALTIPTLQSKDALSEHFRIPLKRVSEILEFLRDAGLIQYEKSRFKKVVNWPHLSGDPVLLARDHANWRLMAIRSFENLSTTDLRYSSVVSLSEEDATRIKSMLLNALKETQQVVRDSKEEKLCSLLIDFFEI